MKVEKLAKNGEKGQNCYPLSPSWMANLCGSKWFDPKNFYVFVSVEVKNRPSTKYSFFTFFHR